MRFFNLGRDKSQTSKESSPTEAPKKLLSGAFGKIATEQDFFYIDSNWREIRGLDEVLQGVYSELTKSEDLYSYEGSCVLLVGGEGRQGIFSIIYPSQDKAGRKYPFVLFNRISDSDFYFKTDALLMAGIAAFEKLLALPFDRILSEKPDANWLNKLQSSTLSDVTQSQAESRKSGMALAEKVTLQEWLWDIVGKNEAEQSLFLSSLCVLVQNVKQGRIQKSSYGIWLPLQSDNPNASAAFWLQLLSTLMIQEDWRPDIVLGNSKEGRRLYVLSKPLTQSSFLATTGFKGQSMGYVGWDDVSDADATSKMRMKISQWLSKKHTTLLDVAVEWYQIF